MADSIAALAGDDGVVFLALGGVGEIGMNLYLYGHDGKWLMIDCGVTFGDDHTPGIDVITADPSFIAERRDDLVGLLLTHGHEDHIGAVPHLWPRLRCPVYATPFTAELVRGKLREVDFGDAVPLHEVDPSSRFEIAPFDLELIALTHSIPEMNAVVLRTPAGKVLHTGDWKLDPEPLVGVTTDEAALRRLGEAGVLAVIGDSTNALVEGTSGSEAEVRDSLLELVGRFTKRVAITCFASNVARIKTLAEVALAHDRHPVLVGRSMVRLTDAARATGYLDDLPAFVSEEDAGFLPRDKVLLMCTGSQGEPRAALSRIARDDHANVTLEAGDAVVFSSRIIPGNEVAIGRLQNQLVRMGVEVVTERDHLVHVSGHPARDELLRMYQWVHPHIVVPAHGEARHLLAHAELAAACQVPHAPVIANGDVLRLSAEGAEIVAQVQHGALALDGTELVALEATELRSRNRMLRHGSTVLTLVVDRNGGLLADPVLTAPGLLGDGDAALADDVVDDVLDALEDLPAAARRSDDAMVEAAGRALRRAFRKRRGKFPTADVHLVRL